MLNELNKTKYRYIKLHSYQREECFEGIKFTKYRGEGMMMSCNREYIVVVLESGGGSAFTVLKTKAPGRYDNVPKFFGHSATITDICISPMQVDRIVSCDEAGVFMFWQVLEQIQEETDEVIGMVQVSSRRGVQSMWHPLCEDACFCASQDKIALVNCVDYTIAKEFDLTGDMDGLLQFSLNYDCSKIAFSNKNKKITIIDTHTSNLLAQFMPHDGARPIRVAYHSILEDCYLITTGSTKSNERQIALWKIDGTDAHEISRFDIDNDVSALNITCDDLGIVILSGKGDGSLRTFEIIKDPIRLFDIGARTLKTASSAICFSNKLACNVKINELCRGYKIDVKNNIEPISIVATRKSNTYQSDLYPDLPGEEPTMTLEDYLQGKRSTPKLVNAEKTLYGGSGTMKKSSTFRKVATKSSASGFEEKDVWEEIESLKKMIGDLKKEIQILKEN